jgi:hypothetical protein
VEPTFFATPADFRVWLEEHRTRERELLVGYRKKGAGRPRTRERRLAALIADSAAGRTIGPLTRPGG